MFITVCSARGFVVELRSSARRHPRAALSCLPFLPPAPFLSRAKDRPTCPLLSPLGDRCPCVCGLSLCRCRSPTRGARNRPQSHTPMRYKALMETAFGSFDRGSLRTRSISGYSAPPPSLDGRRWFSFTVRTSGAAVDHPRPPMSPRWYVGLPVSSHGDFGTAIGVGAPPSAPWEGGAEPARLSRTCRDGCWGDTL